MVITISCPSCFTSFPVDTAKVPVEGVNARCSNCSDIFRVERPPEAAAGFEEPLAAPNEDWMAGMDTSAAESAPAEAPAFEAPGGGAGAEDTFFGGGAAAEDPLPSFEEPAAEAPPAPSFDETAATEVIPPVDQGGDAAPQAFSFGQRDPLEKAKRLARVLVSDMIMYNPERHEQALANGTLREDFEEEIEKSWKEYVDQVGEELAEANDFWKEALNEVLAKGAPIF